MKNKANRIVMVVDDNEPKENDDFDIQEKTKEDKSNPKNNNSTKKDTDIADNIIKQKLTSFNVDLIEENRNEIEFDTNKSTNDKKEGLFTYKEKKDKLYGQKNDVICAFSIDHIAAGFIYFVIK